MSANFLLDLNQKQLEAVKCIDGPLLVLAGAGSGKTRVIIYRLAYLIKSGVDPRNILAVTFTNKAAGEMRERLVSLVGEHSGKLWISTFHAACVRILRSHIQELGFNRNFVIYNASDQLSLVKECLKDLSLDSYRVNPSLLLSRISQAKNYLLRDNEIKIVKGDFWSEKIGSIYAVYQRKLKENNALDFDDLISFTVELFKSRLDILHQYQNQFQYVMVYEYQDTNFAQYQLIHLLTSSHQNICVVGDEDQSIYQWRGADINNILNFEKDYRNAKVIRLEQNYRSTQVILESAGTVIKNNRQRKGKNLWTTNSYGNKIIYFSAPDEQDEAQFISEQIKALLTDGNYKDYSSFAIFYRTHAQSRAIEDGLRRANIPYSIVGGTKFYDRKEIKDLLAYLRLLVNPTDILSLKRILNVPRRGLGAATIDKLEDYLRDKNLNFWDCLRAADEIPKLSAAAKRKLRGFVSMIEDLRAFSRENNVEDTLRKVINYTGYEEEIKNENSFIAKGRLENIQEFFSAIQQFVAEKPDTSLDDFLEGISLATDLDGWEGSSGAVTLMTLHNAKGLEFPAVFVAGLEEGLFPHINSADNASELEEERRLCYVGMTRAKKRLFFTSAQKRRIYVKMHYNRPSSFISEIPAKFITPAFSEKKCVGVMERPKSSTPAYNVGERLRHSHWGEGIVVAQQGWGDEMKIEINFAQAGRKRLLAKVAKLERIQPEEITN